MLASGNADAQNRPQYDDPGQPGHYAVEHTSYLLTNKDAGNRPVFLSVWYPVNGTDIHPTTRPAKYLTDPFTNLLPPTYWAFTANPTYSTDWENLGYDPAFEGPKAYDDGPSPLVMIS